VANREKWLIRLKTAKQQLYLIDNKKAPGYRDKIIE